MYVWALKYQENSVTHLFCFCCHKGIFFVYPEFPCLLTMSSYLLRSPISRIPLRSPRVTVSTKQNLMSHFWIFIWQIENMVFIKNSLKQHSILSSEYVRSVTRLVPLADNIVQYSAVAGYYSASIVQYPGCRIIALLRVNIGGNKLLRKL